MRETRLYRSSRILLQKHAIAFWIRTTSGLTAPTYLAQTVVSAIALDHQEKHRAVILNRENLISALRERAS
jgi:hypothetical protein